MLFETLKELYMTHLYPSVDVVALSVMTIGALYVLFAFIRFLYYYAKAEPVGDIENSSFTLSVDKPRGVNPIGCCVDALVITLFGCILAWIWPIVLAFIIIFLPLRRIRQKNLKKKEFIGKLDGHKTF